MYVHGTWKAYFLLSFVNNLFGFHLILQVGDIFCENYLYQQEGRCVSFEF